MYANDKPIVIDTKPQFADGSDLPEYTPGGSLHRSEKGRERIHSLSTTDAELVADFWGVLVDFEVNTAAIEIGRAGRPRQLRRPVRRETAHQVESALRRRRGRPG